MSNCKENEQFMRDERLKEKNERSDEEKKTGFIINGKLLRSTNTDIHITSLFTVQHAIKA
jgi:hypothetical protein